MTKVVPKGYTEPGLGDFYTGREAADDVATNLIEALHTTWSQRGALVGGMIFDPPLEVTSTTYTQVDDAGSVRDLTRWNGASRLLRDGASSVRVALRIFGENLTVRLTATALDTNTLLGTLEMTLGTPSEGNIDAMTLTLADAHEGGSTANPKRHVAYKIEIKTASGTGELFGFEVREGVETAGSLPG